MSLVLVARCGCTLGEHGQYPCTNHSFLPTVDAVLLVNCPRCPSRQGKNCHGVTTLPPVNGFVPVAQVFCMERVSKGMVQRAKLLQTAMAAGRPT